MQTLQYSLLRSAREGCEELMLDCEKLESLYGGQISSITTIQISFSALGIICNMCTPQQSSPSNFCNSPSDLQEVNCDNQNGTVPGTNISATYDSCITVKIVANLGTTHVMECAVKVTMHDDSDNSLTTCRSPLL